MNFPIDKIKTYRKFTSYLNLPDTLWRLIGKHYFVHLISTYRSNVIYKWKYLVYCWFLLVKYRYIMHAGNRWRLGWDWSRGRIYEFYCARRYFLLRRRAKTRQARSFSNILRDKEASGVDLKWSQITPRYNAEYLASNNEARESEPK